LKIKISKQVAQVFRPDKNLVTQESSTWLNIKNEPLKYYSLNDNFSSSGRVFNDLRRSNDYYSISLTDFGSSLINNSTLNFSILRTVGIENGITIKCRGYYTADELKNYCDSLAELIKKTYQTIVKPIIINCDVIKK